MNYYNENDPKAAAWLRELIKHGHIAQGEVDERSIADVQHGDLAGYIQCHFFAGIGGWSYALRLAGWPDDRPVWTGSCPCQPFSVAGKGGGASDARHLWPVFGNLIAHRRPARVFGEQVASKDGREWLAGVRLDLEGLGYAVGAADMCAAGAGAPHIRQRLYWVADAASARCLRAFGGPEGEARDEARLLMPGTSGATGGMGDADIARPQGRSERSDEHADQRAAWSASDVIHCTDGKSRRVESGTFPLAHGIPARMGRLRGYGNAIVPQVAAEFIRAAGHF